MREPLGLIWSKKDLDGEESQFHILAMSDQKIVGTVVLKPVSKTRIKLRQMAVDSHLQGNGIGKKLVLFAENLAKSKGFQEVLKNSSSWEESGKGHGRLEKRVTFSTSDISTLQEKHQWFGLKSVNMVISERTSTNHLKEKVTSQERRYYISSLPESAKQICQIARQHWGIENKLHWRLDVVYNEDGACIHDETSAINMSTIRKWSLNILQKAKSKPEQSLKSLMRKNAMSLTHALKIVERVFHA